MSEFESILKKELDELRDLNTKLSKALAEEMGSNFKFHSIIQNLEKKLDEIKDCVESGNYDDVELHYKIKRILE